MISIRADSAGWVLSSLRVRMKMSARIRWRRKECCAQPPKTWKVRFKVQESMTRREVAMHCQDLMRSIFPDSSKFPDGSKRRDDDEDDLSSTTNTCTVAIPEC